QSTSFASRPAHRQNRKCCLISSTDQRAHPRPETASTLVYSQQIFRRNFPSQGSQVGVVHVEESKSARCTCSNFFAATGIQRRVSPRIRHAPRGLLPWDACPSGCSWLRSRSASVLATPQPTTTTSFPNTPTPEGPSRPASWPSA